MTTTTRTILSDEEIKDNVLAELKYEPSLKTSDIGILVKDGTVTLNGFATSYWEKLNAVRAAKRVVGVNGIADDIQIKLLGSGNRTDGDIAGAATQQINWSGSVPKDSVTVTVRDGWITLEGSVSWWYEKNAAEDTVRYLLGVKGVYNEISIKPLVTAKIIQEDIKAAFKRSSMLDADDVNVSISGNRVTLSGEVRTYSEKQEADRVAWAAPGVMSVDNLITIDWSWLDD